VPNDPGWQLTRSSRMKDFYFIVNAIKYKKLLDMQEGLV